jgi:branched-chain amino acid transport system ATP-binding protein
MSAPDRTILMVDRLSKSYGGVVANRDVTLNVRAGEIHALIGPNGAGKTTLISMLAGEVSPDSGRIYLNGHDITQSSAPQRAKRGVRRSFQNTSVFPDLTVLQNANLACQAFSGRTYRIWGAVADDKDLRQRALYALDKVGIASLADRLARALSHGERRHLELAMALVGEPQLLLLDEPFAGMGPAETSEMVDRLRSIKGKQAILLIEHDLDAVFSLADRLTVMVMGTPIITDKPAVVRANAEVQAAYFGSKAAKSC